ncbi:putative Protein phosphatase-2c [Quillaja saponaria]|uniref:PPM-type phosphatase domain-containing protein n=1 Tax=Quillaja saponaria TaxID=32244 RepID=A0AAD7PJW8_QUISA|nr:putative Protein phosphatase-2c [Quillaja saponaria]
MGTCISLASSEIHGVEVHVNMKLYEENINVPNGTGGLGSVFTEEGSKGLNQDAAILYQGYGMEDGAFCGVFDGHGRNGHTVSKIVSNRLPSLLLSQKNALAKINELIDGNDITDQIEMVAYDSVSTKNFHTWKEAIVSVFKVMDKEIKLQVNLDCSGSGTTAVVVIKEGEDLIIANLGDSRAVLGTISKSEIAAVQLTTDLKPGLPCEADRIRKVQWSGICTKGRTPYPASISHIHRLTSSDQFIVLASDGVWDVISNKEVMSIVWAADSEEAAAKAVVEAATIAWKNKFPSAKVDDCTVVCLFLHKKQCTTMAVDG